MNYLNMKTFPKAGIQLAAVLSMALFAALAAAAFAQPESSSHVFRLDGGNTSYVFGVNERGELQQIYWGGRIAAADPIPAPHSDREAAAFDSSYSTTPQEYAGWGAGLFNEPALKVTFADGNRDLVLHYLSSSKPDDHSLEIKLKDISRAIIVTLHYSMDAQSGILARSATIESGEPKPILIEQAAAAAFALPPAHYTLNYLTGRWAGAIGLA